MVVMIESGPLSAPPAILAEHEGEVRADSRQSPQLVEERLRRLEDAVAELQERRSTEATVITPLAEPQARQNSAMADVLRETGQRLLPVAIGLLQRPPVATLAPRYFPSAPTTQRRPWLLFDTLDDLRLIVQMFADRRYRVGWVTILVPLCVFFLMIGSSMVIGGLPIIGSTFDKLIDLLLAFFVYKVLTREAQRYREALSA